jgi:hypothetical protein
MLGLADLFLPGVALKKKGTQLSAPMWKNQITHSIASCPKSLLPCRDFGLALIGQLNNRARKANCRRIFCHFDSVVTGRGTRLNRQVAYGFDFAGRASTEALASNSDRVLASSTASLPVFVSRKTRKSSPSKLSGDFRSQGVPAAGISVSLILDRVVEQRGDRLVLASAVFQDQAGNSQEVAHVGDVSALASLMAAQPRSEEQGGIESAQCQSYQE